VCVCLCVFKFYDPFHKGKEKKEPEGIFYLPNVK
jgi:hypothetical protein